MQFSTMRHANLQRVTTLVQECVLVQEVASSKRRGSSAWMCNFLAETGCCYVVGLADVHVAGAARMRSLARTL